MSIKLMTIVWDHFPRGGGEKLVLLALADWGGDDGGRIYPSVASVAKKTNMSERQVQRILARFVSEGVLTVTGYEQGGRNKPRHYRMNIDAIKGDILSSEDSGRVTSATLKGDICDVKGDIAMSPDPLEPLDKPLPPFPPKGENESPEPLFASNTSQDHAETSKIKSTPRGKNCETAAVGGVAAGVVAGKGAKRLSGAISGHEMEFDKFWSVYPKQRRGSRDKAKAAYQKAVQRGFSGQEILAGAQAYAASSEVFRGYAKGAAAWLNDDRFTHDYSEVANGKDFRRGGASPTKTERLNAAVERAIANSAHFTGWGGASHAGADTQAMLPSPEPLWEGAGANGGDNQHPSDGAGGLHDRPNPRGLW